jgi:hypothetical protein
MRFHPAHNGLVSTRTGLAAEIHCQQTVEAASSRFAVAEQCFRNSPTIHKAKVALLVVVSQPPYQPRFPWLLAADALTSYIRMT